MGNIAGGSFSAGGIAGVSRTDSKINNCYNIGKITSVVQYNKIKAIEGAGNAIINNCYYINNCGATGNAISKTEEEMKSQEFVTLLNENDTQND